MKPETKFLCSAVTYVTIILKFLRAAILIIKSINVIGIIKKKGKKHPKAKFFFKLALDLEKSGKKEAEKYFKKAAKLNPMLYTIRKIYAEFIIRF